MCVTVFAFFSYLLTKSELLLHLLRYARLEAAEARQDVVVTAAVGRGLALRRPHRGEVAQRGAHRLAQAAARLCRRARRRAVTGSGEACGVQLEAGVEDLLEGA